MDCKCGAFMYWIIDVKFYFLMNTMHGVLKFKIKSFNWKFVLIQKGLMFAALSIGTFLYIFKQFDFKYTINPGIPAEAVSINAKTD